MNRMRDFRLWTLCLSLVIGMMATVTGQETTIFSDDFESPVVTGRVEQTISGWQSSNARIGLWNEDSGTMTTPSGNQCAYIWNQRIMSTTGITDTLQANSVYTLTFTVAAENALGDIEFDAELLAGDVVIAATKGSNLITTSDHSMAGTLVFTTTGTHPQLGGTLQIRFTYSTGKWQYVMGLDDVKLTRRTLTSMHVWNGQGADTNFSTAANWSTGTAPGTDSVVVFDGTSSKNCVIDSNISIGALEVKDSYTGIIGAGSNTITINNEYVKTEGSGFSADASTIIFASAGTQQLIGADGASFYDIKNSKTGGTLFVSVSNPTHLQLNLLTAKK